MLNTDLNAFGSMLDAVCSLLSRGAYQPNPLSTALFFRSLARYTLAEVRAGFDAHVADKQRGRFVPVPADISSQIEDAAADDGRPGVESAWALAMQSADERETIVWTAEMAQAWASVAPLFRNGDEIGARMAFKEAYSRMVDEARAARRAPIWMPTLGFDLERRTAALVAARHLLEPSPDMPLIASRARLPLSAPAGDALQPVIDNAPADVREALLALRERTVAAARERSQHSPDADEKLRTDVLRRAAADQTAERQREIAERTPAFVAVAPNSRSAH
jgi:hypothetical protein